MLDSNRIAWEKESIDELIPYLYSGPEDKCFNSVVQLKNLAIGSNKQKDKIIKITPRLLQLLIEEIDNEQLLYEIGALLCTLSKGTKEHVKCMIESEAIQILIEKITHSRTSRPIVEICLRTLRSLFLYENAPTEIIYNHFSGVPFIAYLLNMIAKSTDQLNEKSRLHNYSTISTDNWHIQECILNILASSCKTEKEQNLLCQYSCISTISDLLLNDSVRVSKAALNLLAQLCFENKEVSKIALDTRTRSLITNYEVELVELLYHLLDLNETQLYAAKCFTNLFRSNVLSFEIKRHEDYIYKSLKVLIRTCKKENHPLERILAAEILSYLIEKDSNLQRLSAICDHLIPSLANYLTFNLDNLDRNQAELNNMCNKYLLKEFKKEEIENGMKESAFKVLAGLASTDEEIRKKIIDTESLMMIVVNSISEENQEVKIAALRCLHNLSRSVRQLQTAFQDHIVWRPLRTELLNAKDIRIIMFVTSILCNVFLEFSPSKPHFQDKSVIEFFCALTKREEKELRLNGIWALMNMACQSDANLSLQIFNCLGIDQIFNLIKDEDSNIVLKTLGFLRNSLFSHDNHIMQLYGNQIMEILNMCLNDELQVPEEDRLKIKEEAMCSLGNIANIQSSKEFIISNEELLKKLHSIISSNGKPEINNLQIATVLCITNLIWSGKEAAEYKIKLKSLGFLKSLKVLMNTENTELFAKVRTVLSSFQSKDSFPSKDILS